MSFKTDRGRVDGLGSAKEGVHEWWSGRVLSVALIPLALYFICTVAPLIGETHAEVTAAFQSPFTAVMTILFVFIACIHLAAGLQEVLLDYVHNKGTLVVLLITTKLFCWAMGFAGAFAVAKMAFGA